MSRLLSCVRALQREGFQLPGKACSCLGATWTFARGNFRANGPTKSLCSTANVGSTMCSTGQPSSFTSAMHSLHRIHLGQQHVRSLFHTCLQVSTVRASFRGPDPHGPCCNSATQQSGWQNATSCWVKKQPGAWPMLQLCHAAKRVAECHIMLGKKAAWRMAHVATLPRSKAGGRMPHHAGRKSSLGLGSHRREVVRAPHLMAGSRSGKEAIWQ